MKKTAALFALLFLAACSHSYPQAPRQLTTDQAVYRLNSGDEVKVTVFDEPDMTGKYIVDSQGMLALPLVGKTPVSGQTEQQAAQGITAMLQKSGYLKHPKVSVETANMRPFYVMGEIEKGGQFPFRNGLTVYQAVAGAGGYTYRADRGDITIRRQTNKGAGAETRLSATEETPVLPGDVIEVGERYF